MVESVRLRSLWRRRDRRRSGVLVIGGCRYEIEVEFSRKTPGQLEQRLEESLRRYDAW